MISMRDVVWFGVDFAIHGGALIPLVKEMLITKDWIPVIFAKYPCARDCSHGNHTMRPCFKKCHHLLNVSCINALPIIKTLRVDGSSTYSIDYVFCRTCKKRDSIGVWTCFEALRFPQIAIEKFSLASTSLPDHSQCDSAGGRHQSEVKVRANN
jgi:hypothetical protein